MCHSPQQLAGGVRVTKSYGLLKRYIYINVECEYWVTGQHNVGFYTGLADSSFDLIGVKTVYYALILLTHNGNGACNNQVDIKDVGVHSCV